MIALWKMADARTGAGLTQAEPGASSMPERKHAGNTTPTMTEVCQRNTESNVKSS